MKKGRNEAMENFKTFNEMTLEEKKESLVLVAEECLSEMYDELESAHHARKGFYMLKDEFSYDDPEPEFRIKDIEVLEDNSIHVGLITAEVGCMGKDTPEDKDYRFIKMCTFRFYIDRLDPDGDFLDYEFFRGDKGCIDYDRTFVESSES